MAEHIDTSSMTLKALRAREGDLLRLRCSLLATIEASDRCDTWLCYGRESRTELADVEHELSRLRQEFMRRMPCLNTPI